MLLRMIVISKNVLINGYFVFKILCHILFREQDGVMVEDWTPNREVLGSIPTCGTMACP